MPPNSLTNAKPFQHICPSYLITIPYLPLWTLSLTNFLKTLAFFLSLSLSFSFMASWGTLKSIFENPLLDSLSSWAQLLPKAETESSLDVFGEICHRVKPVSSPNCSPPPPILLPSSPKPRLDKSSSWNCPLSDAEDNAFEIFSDLCYETNPETLPNSPKESKNLNLCTEGVVMNRQNDCEKKVIYTRSYLDVRSRCNNDGFFPPLLTSFGRGGKPRVYFKSYRRQDGRFVLREIRIPTQRLLHVRREDGRLQMQVVRPVGEIARRLEVKGETENAEEAV